jgi:hypothetical protein
MSTYTQIRDKLAGDLATVSGIGMVKKEAPLATDWNQYLNLFTITHPNDATKKLVSLAWLNGRRSFQETEASQKGSRDEAETIVAVQRDETWEITLVIGYQDHPTYPSGQIFNELIDAIAAKFRMIDPAGFPGTIEEAWPVQLESAGFYVFGEVLCHRAVLTIRLQQRITS